MVAEIITSVDIAMVLTPMAKTIQKIYLKPLISSRIEDYMVQQHPSFLGHQVPGRSLN